MQEKQTEPDWIDGTADFQVTDAEADEAERQDKEDEQTEAL